MKIALYIEEGTEQLVLTPETDHESRMLALVEKGQGKTLEVHRGSFFECRGGWVRYETQPLAPMGRDSVGESLMLVVKRRGEDGS